MVYHKRELPSSGANIFIKITTPVRSMNLDMTLKLRWAFPSALLRVAMFRVPLSLHSSATLRNGFAALTSANACPFRLLLNSCFTKTCIYTNFSYFPIAFNFFSRQSRTICLFFAATAQK